MKAGRRPVSVYVTVIRSAERFHAEMKAYASREVCRCGWIGTTLKRSIVGRKVRIIQNSVHCKSALPSNDTTEVLRMKSPQI